jgi:hypothetical protein
LNCFHSEVTCSILNSLHPDLGEGDDGLEGFGFEFDRHFDLRVWV